MSKSTVETGPDPLADWSYRSADIPERGLTVKRTATQAELAALARAMDIPAVDALDFDYRLQPLAADRYRLTGTISAAVTQACVVSLAPVPATIREDLDEEFWPAEDVPATLDGEEAEHEALAYTAPEAIHHGMIEVGRVVYEQLVAALDPYPRSEGAAFAWEDQTEQESRQDNPFAALARLKDQE